MSFVLYDVALKAIRDFRYIRCHVCTLKRKIITIKFESMDVRDLTAEEPALLDARMEDFRRNPDAGIPLGELRNPQF